MRTRLCSAPVLPELAKPHEPQALGVSQGPQRGIFAFVVLGTFGISSYQWNIVTATIFPPNFKSWGKHVGFQVTSFLEDPGVPYANWSFSDQKLVLPTKEYWSRFKKCSYFVLQGTCHKTQISFKMANMTNSVDICMIVVWSGCLDREPTGNPGTWLSEAFLWDTILLNPLISPPESCPIAMAKLLHQGHWWSTLTEFKLLHNCTHLTR